MASGTTPLMKQYGEIKRLHPDKILFFRMGDFYEMFGEDAVVSAKALNIQLTKRDKNKADSLPLCGIPRHVAEQYLEKLIRLGHKVAVCEQVEDARLAKGLVKREVTRVVTPGTALSQELLDATSFSYVCAVTREKKDASVGVAFCDLSTGEFRFGHFGEDSAAEKLPETLALFGPKEILADSRLGTAFEGGLTGLLRDFSAERGFRFEEVEFSADPEKHRGRLEKLFGKHAFPGTGLEGFPAAISACGALVDWLSGLHLESLDHLRLPREIRRGERMTLDFSTVRNLELFESLTGADSSHTLFRLLNETETPMGARLLRENLNAPFCDEAEINRRLDAVEEAIGKPRPSSLLREKFRATGDLERTLTRITLPGVAVYDLVRLRSGLADFPEVETLLREYECPHLKNRAEGFDALEDLHSFLTASLMPGPALKLKEGGFVADGYDEELDRLRSLRKNAKRVILELENGEKETTKISGLKVKFNRVFGYYIEVSNAWKHRVPAHYVCKQTLANAERYVTQELKELEEEILNAEEKILELELKIFEKIRSEVRGNVKRIQVSSRCIAEFDLILGLAKLAAERDYCRPSFSPSPSDAIDLKKSRHPVIEALEADEPFIPNDLSLSKNGNRMMLITGPNMGGKSTFMRQVALIGCMAQIGSFVPAASAALPLFDRIFTRVGASDNLARGQSTFMVEMNETAVILNNATENSLVILDEIGRGTGTYDGISIAWAIAENLHRKGCYTLFATHYHELTALEGECPGVLNASVSVEDREGGIVFLRKILPGKVNRSYGIQVARLAGLPDEVISKALRVLNGLEAEGRSSDRDESTDGAGCAMEESPPYRSKKKPAPPASGAEQTLIFTAESEVAHRVAECDIDRLTPLQALNFLGELKTLCEK